MSRMLSQVPARCPRNSATICIADALTHVASFGVMRRKTTKAIGGRC